jgi:hypothetical protein
VSWISFFKLGCLQRLARFGSAEPTDLDVDDLEMLGLAVDVQVRKVIDRNMQTAGEDQQSRDRILQGVRRKRFVKA